MRDKGPTPKQIIHLRKKTGLTQTQSAGLIFTTCRAWQQWEAGDRSMHPAFWYLFKLRIDLNHHLTRQ